MKQWLKEHTSEGRKKPLPILSFPSVSLLGTSVNALLCDAQMQANGMLAIAERTNASAAVSFMDLSVEAECFGARVTFSDTEVPTIKSPILNEESDVENLPVPEIGSGRTRVYIDAIREATRLITDRPVFAGMIGPFSLGARLYEMSEIMVLCYDEPEMVHTVLEKATDFLIGYAKAFKEAGANGIVIAEPVAGLLSPQLESEFSSPYLKKIVDALVDDSFLLIYHNCGPNVPRMVDSLLSIGASAYHFGNAVDMKEMLSLFPRDTLVMGNLDPAGILRMGTASQVREETLRLLESCASYPNFLLSSGCDIPPMTPWENLDAFFRANEEFYS